MSVVADRYARAIFELATESSELANVTEQLRNFAASYEASRELQSVLENPLIDVSQRDAILREVAARVSLSEIALNSVRLLADRKRLSSLSAIAARLASLADEQAGIVRATVISATILPESFYERLTSELESVTARKIALDRQQDPSLIAGIVTRIGDNTIDGSIKGRLAEIERQLSNF
jgi:F-type H+-transporting ATPase subunit delta